jgi:hypothetical protein
VLSSASVHHSHEPPGPDEMSGQNPQPQYHRLEAQEHKRAPTHQDQPLPCQPLSGPGFGREEVIGFGHGLAHLPPSRRPSAEETRPPRIGMSTVVSSLRRGPTGDHPGPRPDDRPHRPALRRMRRATPHVQSVCRGRGMGAIRGELVPRCGPSEDRSGRGEGLFASRPGNLTD